jgi:hypothetical protein
MRTRQHEKRCFWVHKNPLFASLALFLRFALLPSIYAPEKRWFCTAGILPAFPRTAGVSPAFWNAGEQNTERCRLEACGTRKMFIFFAQWPGGGYIGCILFISLILEDFHAKQSHDDYEPAL